MKTNDRLRLTLLSIGIVLIAGSIQAQTAAPLRTTDYLVPHISTVPANAGKYVELFVREKVQKSLASTRPAVLFLGGATISAVPLFDLQYENYSWMEYLANAGFDVFAMDFTGYGLSPRPMMENPCNLPTAQQQQLLIPSTLSQPCAPAYPYQLNTIKSEWDEIDRVVDYIQDLRGVDKVHIVGYSRGGVRAAGYAGLHPEKVNRLFLYAPGDNTGGGTYRREATEDSPQPLPLAGTPMQILGTAAFHNAWDAQIGCADQFAPGIRQAINWTMLAFEPLGSTWGSEGVRRAPTLNATTPNWGLTRELVSKITAPTLFIRGAVDATVGLPLVQPLFDDITAVRQKVWVSVACGSHFMHWENQHEALSKASREWLQNGTYNGQQNGRFSVDTKGQIQREP